MDAGLEVARERASTPTCLFIDRKGIVRRYTPTRMTGTELDRESAALHR